MRTSLQLGPIMLLYLLNSLNSSFLSSFFSSGKLVDDDPDYSDELVVSESISINQLSNQTSININQSISNQSIDQVVVSHQAINQTNNQP
jgi:hypothetical protein